MLHKFQQEGSATQQTFCQHTGSAVSKPIDARGGAVLFLWGHPSRLDGGLEANAGKPGQCRVTLRAVLDSEPPAPCVVAATVPYRLWTPEEPCKDRQSPQCGPRWWRVRPMVRRRLGLASLMFKIALRSTVRTRTQKEKTRTQPCKGELSGT